MILITWDIHQMWSVIVTNLLVILFTGIMGYSSHVIFITWDIYCMGYSSNEIFVTWDIHHMRYLSHRIFITCVIYHMWYLSHGIFITWDIYHMRYLSHELVIVPNPLHFLDNVCCSFHYFEIKKMMAFSACALFWQELGFHEGLNLFFIEGNVLHV